MSTKQTLGEYLRSSTRGIIFVLAFFLPLFFVPWTTDALEINKQTLFVMLSCTAAVCWIGSMMADRAVSVQRGWVNILPLLLVCAFFVPALFSSAPYVSWVGSKGQEYTSVLTFLAGAVLFYVVVNTFTERAAHRVMHSVLLFSSIFVALAGMLSIFGNNFFPGSLSQIMAFNTIGTVNAFAVYLIVMSLFSLSAWVAHKKEDSLLHGGILGAFEQVTIIALIAFTFVLLLVCDYWVLWLVFVFGLAAMFVFALFKASYFVSISRFWLPALLLLALLPFWFWLGRPIQVDLPLEVSLNNEMSWNIAEQALRASSDFYGSGPGTYQFAYSQFHDAVINQTDFWNSRFDRASTFVLTLLPTIGYFGSLVFFVFCFILFVYVLGPLVYPRSKSSWLESFVHTIPWLTLVVSAFLYNWNFTLVGFFCLFSALIASQLLQTPAKKDFSKSPALGLVFSVVFLVFTLCFFIGIFVSTQRYAAEVAFAKAIKTDQANGDLQKVVEYLDRAATLNKFDDIYYRNLSAALLMRVDEQISGIGELDALTPESQQYLQSLVAASVNAAVYATELSPNNVANWLIRGMIYREIVSLDSNAIQFAMQSYEQVTQLEPANPANWTELGKAYLVYANSIEPITLSEDQVVAAEATEDRRLALQAAESAFNKAIELKSAYAPAHFQLGITYEFQGRIDAAVGKMESIATYNPLDIGAHFQLGILYLSRDADGDLARAQTVFEKAVEFSPSYSNARWFLAYVYELQGNLVGAIDQVEAVLELNPGNGVVLNRLDRLSRGELEQEIPEEIENIE